MKIISAGLLMFRVRTGVLEFFLVHPGGPFFAKKDLGVWTIPKGLPEAGEEFLETAKREFKEETGISPAPPFIALDSITQKAGKTVVAWAFENKTVDHIEIKSNTFQIEWPPRSKQMKTFPEIDRADWFTYSEASIKINSAQIPFLERLANIVSK